MSQKNQILILHTGGTFAADAYADPNQPPARCSFRNFPGSIDRLIRERFRQDYIFSQSYMDRPRDSNEIDNDIRNKILQIVLRFHDKDIVLIHGTDTLATTANWLQKLNHYFEKRKIRIILVGAMVPWANGANSDAPDNLDFALRKLADGTLVPGVHVQSTQHHIAGSTIRRLLSAATGEIIKVRDAEQATLSAFYFKAKVPRWLRPSPNVA